MLSLRIVRGPLEPREEEAILREFNRLTGSRVPIAHFRRWVRGGPDGPAWHALLEADGAGIVGHFCLIPLRTEHDGTQLVAARTEYFFVHEAFRKEKVRGFENSFLSCAILLLGQLYENCRDFGWGPFLASASDEIQPYHRLAGCRPAEFRTKECLLILRPWEAARRTPNLSACQRAGVFLIGLAQRMFWSAAMPWTKSKEVSPATLGNVKIRKEPSRMSFFQDHDSLKWRYPEDEYVALLTNSAPGDYLIVKHGSEDRYLRVCQWNLETADVASPILLTLIRMAADEGSLGVRWAVYGQEKPAASLVNVLQRHGFLCASRGRTVLFHTRESGFLIPGIWNMNDSFFSFDL